VVDMTPFWEAYRAVEPYMHTEGEAPEKGCRITEQEMEEIYQFINCIMCGCCFSSCPVASRDGAYMGPAALAKLNRFVDDPRDKRSFESWSLINSPEGVWGCDTVFRCNDVCPKNVRPADGIEALRRKLVVGKIKRIFKK
jgi:succinate dehydrogenase / fumarate reductase, iron-sulfur subunit